MIDIKVFTQHHGMVIAYAAKSFDARLAPRVHQFWQTELFNSNYTALHWMVIDLQEVLVMDTSGLAVIVNHYQQLPVGVPLSLVGCNLAISELLKDTYVAKVFPQYKTFNEIPDIGHALKNMAATAYHSHRLYSPW